MKAIVYNKYGSPDVLELKDVARPAPKDHEVLVKVHAASINSWDWDMICGSPFIVRLWGLFKPKYKIPGADIAGIVETVGRHVKKFKPGDKVFGDLAECGFGAFAEYALAKEEALGFKSESMTFEQAACIPQAGMMALQSIRDKGEVQAGQKVLINGAGGGVGTLALQIAKNFGAEVTCVDSFQKHEMLRALGADHVIDYLREDFTRNGKRYELIIDVVSNRSLYDYTRSLSERGVFLMIGGTMSAILQAMLLGRWISEKEGKRYGILAYEANNDLDFFNRLFESGKVVPVIDRCFSLKDTSEAFRYYSSGNVQGKIVIQVTSA